MVCRMAADDGSQKVAEWLAAHPEVGGGGAVQLRGQPLVNLSPICDPKYGHLGPGRSYACSTFTEPARRGAKRSCVGEIGQTLRRSKRRAGFSLYRSRPCAEEDDDVSEGGTTKRQSPKSVRSLPAATVRPKRSGSKTSGEKGKWFYSGRSLYFPCKNRRSKPEPSMNDRVFLRFDYLGDDSRCSSPFRRPLTPPFSSSTLSERARQLSTSPQEPCPTGTSLFNLSPSGRTTPDRTHCGLADRGSPAKKRKCDKAAGDGAMRPSVPSAYTVGCQTENIFENVLHYIKSEKYQLALRRKEIEEREAACFEAELRHTETPEEAAARIRNDKDRNAQWDILKAESRHLARWHRRLKKEKLLFVEEARSIQKKLDNKIKELQDIEDEFMERKDTFTEIRVKESTRYVQMKEKLAKAEAELRQAVSARDEAVAQRKAALAANATLLSLQKSTAEKVDNLESECKAAQQKINTLETERNKASLRAFAMETANAQAEERALAAEKARVAAEVDRDASKEANRQLREECRKALHTARSVELEHNLVQERITTLQIELQRLQRQAPPAQTQTQLPEMQPSKSFASCSVRPSPLQCSSTMKGESLIDKSSPSSLRKKPDEVDVVIKSDPATGVSQVTQVTCEGEDDSQVTRATCEGEGDESPAPTPRKGAHLVQQGCGNDITIVSVRGASGESGEDASATPGPSGAANSSPRSPQVMKVQPMLRKRLKSLSGQEGPEWDRPNHLGERLVHLAAIQGEVQEVERLLRLHPEMIELLTAVEQTPLHCAADHGQAKVVAALLRAGAKPLATDLEKQTPLHRAAFGGHLECCKLLLEAKPKAAKKPDCMGKLPIDRAKMNKHKEIVKLLKGASKRRRTRSCKYFLPKQ